METTKTLKIDIKVSAEEIENLIVEHLLLTDEEIKKIYDKTSKPKFTFISKQIGQINDFVGCQLSIAKTK